MKRPATARARPMMAKSSISHHGQTRDNEYAVYAIMGTEIMLVTSPGT